MTSAIRSLLILLVALPLVIFIGSELGSDDFTVPVVVGGVVMVAMIVAVFFRNQRPECLILGFLLGGYIVGNRGFAQLAIAQPFFVGEMGLAAIVGLMVFRYIFTRESVGPKHALARVILFYLVIAFLQFGYDARVYGINAARDLAIVYYAIFFFIGYEVSRRNESASFIDRALVWTFVLQAVVSVLLIVKPEWLEAIEIRGVPLLEQKGDLTPTFSVMGIFYISLRPDLIPVAWMRRFLITVLLLCVVLIGSRAAFVAAMFAFILPLLAAQRRFLLYPSLLAVIGIVVLLASGTLTDNDRFMETREKLVSIVDFSSSFSYQTDLGELKSATNEFRRELWKSVYEQTTEDNHWIIGRGFGYDFLERFEQSFGGGHWEGLRSAHSYFVTIFGRMGVLGFGLLLAISWLIIQGGLRAALLLRRGVVDDTRALAYWCGLWAILAAGAFGVVLEGPMGAIPFWSFLGIALAQNERISPPATAHLSVKRLSPLAEHWHSPLAKPVGVS